MRVCLLIVGLLILGGAFGGPSPVAAAMAVQSQPAGEPAVLRQQPVSTIPPLPIQPVSTIPPIPPTATPIRPTATPVPRPAPPVVPALPTPIPTRPTAASQVTPRAGGFPIEAALLAFAGSATALGGGLYLFTRRRSR